jgi:uncharacterized protein
MSYTKFHLKNQNKHIFVCNKTNTLYNEDKTLVFSPYYVDSNHDFSSWGSAKKANNPVRIRIILGHACNYSCVYCSQKDIGDPSEKNKNDKLFEFISTFEENIDKSNLQYVELWGGEPFLYWNDMVPLMRYFDNENITFSISTNGSTLMEKHLDFFSTLSGKLDIAISHDGPGQESLRGEDIFKLPRVRKVVKMLDDAYPLIKYNINSVITNTNFDLFAIDTYFKNVISNLKLKHLSINYELGRTYDTKIVENNDYSFSYDSVINGDNLKKFKDILKEYYNKQTIKYKHDFSGIECSGDLISCDSFSNEGSAGVIGYAKLSLLGKYPKITTNCGADWEQSIDVDLNGNVRTCQNAGVDHISGNINNIKNINIFALDLNRKNEEHCSKCPVKLLCKSSCPINLPTKAFLRNCEIEKIWYTEHMISGLNIIFDDEVSIVESGIEQI